MTDTKTISVIYEMPGGMPIAATLEVGEDFTRVIKCHTFGNYSLDPDDIWVETHDPDLGLIPLSMALTLAGESK